MPIQKKKTQETKCIHKLMYVYYPYKSITLNKIKNSWYYVVRPIVQNTFYSVR